MLRIQYLLVDLNICHILMEKNDHAGVKVQNRKTRIKQKHNMDNKEHFDVEHIDSALKRACCNVNV